MSTERDRATGTSRRPDRQKLRRMVLLAMLFALALVLSWLEGMLPPIPAPVPLRLGLSNIAVMYAMYFLGGPSAYVIALLKAFYALLMRGVLPGMLSLAGGLLSVTIMLLLYVLSRKKISLALLSIAGAVSHNIGQFLVLMFNYNLRSIIGVLPIFLVSGVVFGSLSAILLRVIMPALGRINPFSGS